MHWSRVRLPWPGCGLTILYRSPTFELSFEVQFFTDTYFRVLKSFAKIAKIRFSRKFLVIRYLLLTCIWCYNTDNKTLAVSSPADTRDLIIPWQGWFYFLQTWYNSYLLLTCIWCYMVPTDQDKPFSWTFQGLLRYIFKKFSRTFLCSLKHPFTKKWSTMDFSNKSYRHHLILSSPEKWGGGRDLGMCF